VLAPASANHAPAANRGTCVAVTAPRTACDGNGICGGRCDAFNRASCVYRGSTTSCGVPSCAGDSFITQVCGGSGTCTTCQNITAGVGYLFGFRFRGQTPNQGNAGYCDLSFYPGLDCTGEAIFVDDDVPAQVASQGVSWDQASGSATAPGNVRSARMTCIAAIGFGNYDPLYSSRTTVGF
jgi:hypothetical protein